MTHPQQWAEQNSFLLYYSLCYFWCFVASVDGISTKSTKRTQENDSTKRKCCEEFWCIIEVLAVSYGTVCQQWTVSSATILWYLWIRYTLWRSNMPDLLFETSQHELKGKKNKNRYFVKIVATLNPECKTAPYRNKGKISGIICTLQKSSSPSNLTFLLSPYILKREIWPFSQFVMIDS